MLQLFFYVPVNSVDAVKSAVFAAGAGRLGAYECCAWQTLGQGQFKPLPGANPTLGEINQLEVVEEYRVEMVLDEADLKSVVAALKESHPYEEPAYGVFEMVNLSSVLKD